MKGSTDLVCNMAFAEYLISKYGKGRFQISEAGYPDNLILYVVTLFPRRFYTSECCLSQIHTMLKAP